MRSLPGLHTISGGKEVQKGLHGTVKAWVLALLLTSRKDESEQWLEGDIQFGQTRVAAQVYKERSGKALPAVYGCVTTGEDWQFLRLVGTTVTIDQGRLYIDNVSEILATLHASVQQGAPWPEAPLQPTGPA